jgi:2-polyprenyl-6-methoxyphenol hydroxylase-like FAD-dependent oxidoreductase
MAIAIAGGGIAGLAAAIVLAHIGRPAVVFERGEEFAELGAGVQVGPNGVRALHKLGAWKAVANSVAEPRRIVVKDALSGRTLKEVGLGQSFTGRYGAPYLVAHRGDLLAGLVATARELPGIELRTGVAVTGFDILEGRVDIQTEQGEPFGAEALVGADGLHSAVRVRILSPAPPDRAGHALYRALMPIEAVPDGIETDSVALWLYPGGHVVHYAVSGGRKMNVVAAAENSAFQDGWGAPAAPAEVAACFPDAAPQLSSMLRAPDDWRRWAAADRPPAGRWGKGRVTLIGDAAHPVLPYLAQGAVMALEDAVVLGHCLASSSSLEDGFRDYERRRRPRVARLAHLSRRQGRAYHLRGPLRLARNAVVSAMPTEVFLRRLDWLYSWQPPDMQE